MSIENQRLKQELHRMTIKLQKQEENPSDQGGDIMMVPRPFMDLGLAALEDENSRSSSEGIKSHDEIPRLPINNMDGRDLREEIHEQVLACSNKIPRLNVSKNEDNSIDQATEATIRKARVSVRARSESNMVRYWSLENTYMSNLMLFRLAFCCLRCFK